MARSGTRRPLVPLRLKRSLRIQRRWFRLWRWRAFQRNSAIWMTVFAVIIGLGSGIAAVAFRLGATAFEEAFYGFDDTAFYTNAAALPWWHILLAPIIGGLIIGVLTFVALPGRRIHGIADVIEASALRGGRMSLRNGLTSALASVIAIGAGGSTGREGPTVHLTASLSSFLAQKLHLTENMTRTLMGCGVAAGIAASFNAPIAGVFFALEVVIGHYALSAFAPIVIAGVTGTIVSRAVFGDFPAFILPELQHPHWGEYPLFLLLGLGAAVLAIAQMTAIMKINDLFNWSRVPRPLWPAIAGLFIGLLAIPLPHVLGVGYQATDHALQGGVFTLGFLLILTLAKMTATALTLGSGFGVGIFAPALFIGATFGAAFGAVAIDLAPALVAGEALYAAAGMGAVAAAILGAPISTILIIFEMTGDYAVTSAVMLATVAASSVTQSITGKSFFYWQLSRRGVSIGGGREQRIIDDITVGRVMKRDYSTIAPDAPYMEVLNAMGGAAWGELFVTDEQRRLIGVLTIPDVNAAVRASEKPAEELTAHDLCRQSPPVLALNDPLSKAMDVMDTASESHIPVIDSHDRGVVVGFVHEHDVMNAYHKALLKARAEEHANPLREDLRKHV